MIMRINQIIDYFMMVALIFVSGNIAFRSKEYLFVVFILSTILFFYRKAKFDVYFVYFLIVLLVIVILQSFKFNFFPVVTYIGVYIRILIAYFLLKSIDNFIEKFIKVMYYIAIISFIFYLPILLIPGFYEILMAKLTIFSVSTENGGLDRSSILGLYTIVPSVWYKSAGPFWEMGAFGGYLMLTYILSYLRDHNLTSKTNIVLLIAILTTQSSTAYISLMMFLFFIFYNKSKDLLLKIIVVFLLSGFSYVAYVNLPFLGEKIESQLEMAKSMMNAPNLEDADSQRFVNILKDWKDFQGHEWVGRGANAKTRYTTIYDVKEDSDIRTVGSTDMIVRYGLPFFLFMIFLMYKAFVAYSKKYSVNGEYMGASVVLIVLLLLSSEVYFLYPLFWIVTMLQYIAVPDSEGDEASATKVGKFYNLEEK
jgi:hypothetical protein